MEDALRQEKKALRLELRTRLHALDAAYRAASDAAITEQVLALPWWRAANTIFIYISTGGEPDTHRLIEAALAAGKRVCAPACLPGGVMVARRLAGLDEAVPGAYGLLEPPPEMPPVPPEELGLVVAPCVAADEAGRRLGNGGGYYDRYLPQVRCPVVCLCRGALLQPALPAGPRDRPVDLVLTEDGAWPAPAKTLPGPKAGLFPSDE